MVFVINIFALIAGNIILFAPLIGLILSLALRITAYSFLSLGLYSILIDLVDGNDADFSQLFGRVTGLLSMVGANILFGIMMFFIGLISLVAFFLVLARSSINYLQLLVAPDGLQNMMSTYNLINVMVLLFLILFTVPGIYVICRFGFFPFCIVDRNDTALQSLTRSSQLTKGHRMKSFLFLLVSGVIAFLGALVFGVGLIVVIPIILCAMAHIYRKLDGQSSRANVDVFA